MRGAGCAVGVISQQGPVQRTVKPGRGGGAWAQHVSDLLLHSQIPVLSITHFIPLALPPTDIHIQNICSGTLRDDIPTLYPYIRIIKPTTL